MHLRARAVLQLALLAVLALLGTALTGGAATTPPTVNVADASGNNVMDPSATTINTGDTVKFHWNEGGHNVHFKSSPEGDVDLGYHSTGYETTHTFTKPGTYSFVCDSHSKMTGTITVKAAGSGTTTPPPPPPPSNAVNVANAKGDNVMDPSSLAIKTGDAVKFHWNEGGHNVHFKSSPEGDVDLGYHSTGYEVSHTFTKPGTYSFVCDSHSGMKGTINVTGAPVPPPTQPPPTTTPPPATDPPAPPADPLPASDPPVALAPATSSDPPTATAAVASADAGAASAAPASSDAGPPTVRMRAAKGTLSVQASEPVRLFMRAVRVGARGHRVYQRTINLRAGANRVYLRDWLWGRRYRLELSAVDADRNAIKPVRMRISIR